MRCELGRYGGQNSACDYAYVCADQLSELITSLARHPRGFNARVVRYVNNISDVLQTNLDVLERHFNMRASTRRPGSEETKSRGERSSTYE